ncbi:non-homologous end-joining DNA ligase [Streptomyces sp. 7-21]|uniref:non-homologous end-joining DNA ligase n=1 Tax=Streptomyces sp. 7-21 TaxID=2802283 RepID=UPI00191DE295|nr:non-homologous end-joining DNA ligase [Streptomyces sp. 7-21]MBL1065233.1 non-homologous end-joining DNA ligase [Streptomyces sp. 7-21]
MARRAGDGGEDVPQAVAPMLATDAPLPDAEGWAYEYKWDGYRCCLCAAPSGTARLTSRGGKDLTATYPELARLPRAVTAGGDLVLDGEIVALDADGRPDFGLLQRRHQRSPGPGVLAGVPVTYFAFDVLRLGGQPLLDETYRRRRERLAELAARTPADFPALAVPPHYPRAEIGPGDLLGVARRHGLEGVVAKRLDSPYLPGRRSRLWVKKALFATQEVVIGGWQPGSGHRAASIGSLLLGAHDAAGALRYIGHVGTGFSDRALAGLSEQLAPLARPGSPFANAVPAPQARRARWVAPRLTGEVAFRTWTRDRRLRHPVWRGLRPDVAPGDVRLPDAAPPA